jgi:hypothetical protein
MPMTERDRKVLKYGGIAVGAILALFFVSKMLSGSGGALPPLPSFPPPSNTGGSPTPTAGVLPPPAANLRDPFAVPGGVAPSTGSPQPSGSGSPSQSVSPTSSSPTPTLPGNGASIRIGGHTVVLLDVYALDSEEHAQVEVDGTVYRPAVGQRFAGGGFRLRSTNGDCAGFLFGDQSFNLCTRPQK